MFSQASVILSMGGMQGKGGMHGEEGACMAKGACAVGGVWWGAYMVGACAW